jgi:hypothetical protein
MHFSRSIIGDGSESCGGFKKGHFGIWKEGIVGAESSRWAGLGAGGGADYPESGVSKFRCDFLWSLLDDYHVVSAGIRCGDSVLGAQWTFIFFWVTSLSSTNHLPSTWIHSSNPTVLLVGASPSHSLGLLA